MSFLKFDPSVFIIGEEYEITLITEECGIAAILVGTKIYYEENTGVLSTEKNRSKIRVPMAELDAAREYTVIFRKTIERKAYFSRIGDPVSQKYSFRPIPSEGEVRIYYLSDVHYVFPPAVAAAGYFGEDTDLYVIGGDIGEVETVENYEGVLGFLSDIAGGERPMVFVRGNHDTRGHLAELYTDYFPADGKKTYFTFKAGYIYGIVFDAGEDKPDSCPEYTYPKPDVFGGVNIFEEYRSREDSFFESLREGKEGEVVLAIGHIPPAYSNRRPGTVFDIERERYDRWNRELERVGVDIMLSGHYHSCFMLLPGDERSNTDHNYPIVIGSEPAKDNFIGTALRLTRDGYSLAFTDKDKTVLGEYSGVFS